MVQEDLDTSTAGICRVAARDHTNAKPVNFTSCIGERRDIGSHQIESVHLQDGKTISSFWSRLYRPQTCCAWKLQRCRPPSQVIFRLRCEHIGQVPPLLSSRSFSHFSSTRNDLQPDLDRRATSAKTALRLTRATRRGLAASGDQSCPTTSTNPSTIGWLDSLDRIFGTPHRTRILMGRSRHPTLMLTRGKV